MKNLPNLISLTRIFSIPLFIALMVYDHSLYALGLFIAAAMTDALDGFIARRWKLKTKLGAYLDPVADKLLLVSVFITLACLGIVPIWITIIIVGRDVLLAVTGLIILNFIDRHSYQIRPSVLGKATTVLQILTILAALLDKGGKLFPTVLWGTAVITAVSGLHYVFREGKVLWRRLEP